MTATQMGLLAFAAVMLENILRSTQSKNVTAGYTKAVFFTGGLMTLCDGVVMTIIAVGGLGMLPYTVTASAIGWVIGIKLHDRITANHRAKLKAEKKAKKKLRIQRAVEKAIVRKQSNFVLPQYGETQEYAICDSDAHTFRYQETIGKGNVYKCDKCGAQKVLGSSPPFI